MIREKETRKTAQKPLKMHFFIGGGDFICNESVMSDGWGDSGDAGFKRLFPA
jgi:hypothetical protein